MSFRYETGDLLTAQVDAVVNTVNTVGVMGKGLALSVKTRWPEVYREYRRACLNGDVTLGKMHVVDRGALGPAPRYVINFPTKGEWRLNSRLDYIESGLVDLRKQIEELQLTSIAIPPLGCGNGGLQWSAVHPLIKSHLGDLADLDIALYAPNLDLVADRVQQRDNDVVRSRQRVRQLGEVMTPPSLVDKMLDLLPADTWEIPSKTFLEPSCGDGNFLVAILSRKLTQVVTTWRAGALPAGSDTRALEFHMLESLASLYGVDISADNIVGGGEFGIRGARDRVADVFATTYANATGRRLSGLTMGLATQILKANIQVGNFLTGRRDDVELTVLSYEWNADTLTVRVTEEPFPTTVRSEFGLFQSASDSAKLPVIWEGSIDSWARALKADAPELDF